MAALLVSLAVMGVLMSVAMPVWRHDAQREKEAELVWRAGQIVRAVELYRKRVVGAQPTSLDQLVQMKVLRKKYKDPMTKDGEWRYLTAQEMSGMPIIGGAPGQLGPDGRPLPQPRGSDSRFGQSGMGQSGTSQSGMSQPGGSSQSPGSEGRSGFGSGSDRPSTFGAPREGQTGPFSGVASKSKANSIRVFKGRTRYDQWIVTIDDVRGRFGQAGMVQPGQQPGQQPGRFPGSQGGSPTSPRPGGSPLNPGSGFPSTGSPRPQM